MGTICAIEHGENFRQRHGAHLHAAERKLFAGDAAGEIVHQFFFAHGEALNDARFLALEGFAFEHLRNAAAQKIDAGLDFFLEGVGLAARQSEQARPVGIFEIIHVAAIRSGLALRVHALRSCARSCRRGWCRKVRRRKGCSRER